MTIKRGFFFRGVFLVIVFCIGTSIGQDLCNSYTLIKVPDASPLNQTAIIGNASESYCQSSCFNQNNCYGYTWLSGICYQNLNSFINYTAPNATYYSLIRSLPNCNQTSTCFWSGVKDIHGFGGVRNDKTNLNDCITSCQQTASCVAVDWNTDDNSCWFPSPDYPTGPATGIYHFPKNCQNVTTLPSTSTTTTATTTSGTLPGTPTMPTVSTTQSAPSSSVSSSPSSTASSVVSTSSTTTTTQAPLCNGIQCGRGEICGPVDMTCVCITVCTQDHLPVCGSDNKTYNNECELDKASCNANETITRVRYGACNSAPGPIQSPDDDSKFASYPMAIKPAYIVLAGLGGGCLLLVLTAIIILCEYPLHGAETYSSSGTLVKGTHGQDIHMSSAVVVEDGEGGGGGEENVEFNPYYNRSELGAPDFTKEENIM